jgi:septin family protein
VEKQGNWRPLRSYTDTSVGLKGALMKAEIVERKTNKLQAVLRMVQQERDQMKQDLEAEVAQLKASKALLMANRFKSAGDR